MGVCFGGRGQNKVTESPQWLTLGEVRTGPGRKQLLDEEYFEKCFHEEKKQNAVIGGADCMSNTH